MNRYNIVTQNIVILHCIDFIPSPNIYSYSLLKSFSEWFEAADYLQENEKPELRMEMRPEQDAVTAQERANSSNLAKSNQNRESFSFLKSCSCTEVRL